MRNVYTVPLAGGSFCHPGIQSKLAEFVKYADRLSYGEVTYGYEKMFAEWNDSRHCVAVNSGSSANLAVIQACLERGDLKIGDYVGVSSLTWSTNVMPIIQLGLLPVPIDVYLDDLNIRSDSFRRANDHFQLRGLFITHLLGLTSKDFDLIVDYCNEASIVLLEDTCESLGTIYKSQKLGTFGLASTFSTFVGHHFSTVEGGLICTDDDELSDILRSVISHGWRRHRSTVGNQSRFSDSSRMLLNEFYEKYTFHTLGFNLRPNEITSYAGILSIPFLDDICSLRQRNFELMTASRDANPAFGPHSIKANHLDLCSSFAFPVVLPTEAHLYSFLTQADRLGIETRPLVAGNIASHPFSARWFSPQLQKWCAQELTNASILHKTSCYIPNRHNLSDEQLNAIYQLFHEYKHG